MTLLSCSEVTLGKSFQCPRKKDDEDENEITYSRKEIIPIQNSNYFRHGTQFVGNTERAEFLSGTEKGQTLVKILNKTHLHINKNALTFIGPYV
jgi:hypothetical protein